MVDKEPSLEGEDFKKVRLSDDSGAGLDLDLEPDSMSTVKIKKSSKFTKHELQSPGKTISYMTHSSNSPKSSSSPMLNFTEYSTQFDMHYEDTDHMAVINTFTVHTDLPTEPEGGFAGADLFSRRSPFVHNPPILEERRPRIEEPHGVCDYLINLREDLADFQESHGLPRSKDYSFLSLGLALAQETGRTLYAVLIMITELFPVLAILSLIIRFILDQVTIAFLARYSYLINILVN